MRKLDAKAIHSNVAKMKVFVRSILLKDWGFFRRIQQLHPRENSAMNPCMLNVSFFRV